MLTKKTATAASSTKAGSLRNKKKKSEATFEFSGFQDEIRVQAYYNYLKRTKNDMSGNEITDWLEAENILRSKASTH